MPDVDIGSADYSDLSNSMVDYSVGSESTDAGEGSVEFRYTNSKWMEQFGYYKNIPELKIAIDTKADWVLGNGYEADDMTTAALDMIKGSGKDSFNSILTNMERTCYIGEDAYAEIITNKNQRLINLKVLDPSTITVVHNKQGRILRYEQSSKVTKDKKNFMPHEMFVLSHNRTADEVHGVSVVCAVEKIILARNEAMSDWKRVLHRNVEPLFIFHLDTDDTTKIAEIKTKYNTARKEGENLFVPKGCVVPELVTVAANATLNPVTWINQLNDYFFQAVGVPQIIIGNAKEFTDASAKIVYLAFEQRIKSRQKYVEEQVANQLNVLINLVFPASLQNEAISGQPAPNDMETQVENEPMEKAAQPNDTKTEVEGKT